MNHPVDSKTPIDEKLSTIEATATGLQQSSQSVMDYCSNAIFTPLDSALKRAGLLKVAVAGTALVLGVRHLIEYNSNKNSDSNSPTLAACAPAPPTPVFLANEFITTALKEQQRKELRHINRGLTRRIVNIYTPDPDDLGLTTEITATGTNLVMNEAKTKTESKIKTGQDQDQDREHCAPITPKHTNKFDALAPTNQLLWGTRTITAVLQLYAQGFSKSNILRLDAKYDIVWPWTIQYHSDRLANNERLQYFPLMIVFVRNTKEVSKWIKITEKHKVLLSMRSGGHSYEAYSASQPVVLDCSNLVLDCCCDPAIETPDNAQRELLPLLVDKQMELCKKTGILQVAPGVRLGTIYAALAKENRIVPGGICPSVCIGGLVLGGGLGYFTRAFGYACDNVSEFELVLASGKAVVANQKHHSDLFRALKGSGQGNYGVVTRIAIQTYVVKHVVAYSCTFQMSDFVPVLRQFQQFVAHAPRELASMIVYAVAGVPFIAINGQFILHVDKILDQRHQRGKHTKHSGDGCVHDAEIKANKQQDDDDTEKEGDDEESAKNAALKAFNCLIQRGFLEPLANESVSPVLASAEVTTYIELEKELAATSLLSPFYKFRSRYLYEPGMTDSELTQMADLLAVPPLPDLTDMSFVMNIAAFGPGNNDVPVTDSVLPARGDSLAYILIGTQWNSPLARDELLAFEYVNNFYNVISGFSNMNNNDANSPDSELGPLFLSGYYGANFLFTIDVKKKYDPKNVFQFLQSIPVIP